MSHDHNPIILDLEFNNPQLGSPFKFNLGRIEEVNFQSLVKDQFRHCNPNLDLYACEQFATSLKAIKERVSV